MKIRFFICLSFLLALPLSAVAQENNILLNVRVVDSFTERTLPGVTVTVLEQDSTTVLLEKMVQTTSTTGGGETKTVSCEYKGNVPRRSDYILKINLDNYISRYVRVSVPARKFGRPVKEWFVKDIPLSKDYSSLDRTLGEATVTASRVAMVVKGDTIEYDARAFRLAEGSMLDNLVGMLPGVRLTSDGQIFVNGEHVKKLMLNGRNFFAGNPKVALDNLPAYTVDKVKVYHEGPAWEHLIDEKNRDDNRRPMVMDVRLKREYVKNWLANFEVGGGSKTHGGWDDIYLARFFGLRITEHSSLGAYGGTNNLSDEQSPGRKGEWRKSNVTEGDKKVVMGGVNLDFDGKRSGINFNNTLEARREEATNGYVRTSVSNDGWLRRRTQTVSGRENFRTNVKWNGNITGRTKRSYFSLTPKVSYDHDRARYANDTEQRNSQEDAEGGSVWESGYMRGIAGADHGDKWRAGLDFMSKIKSPLSGKNYDFSGKVSYTHNRNSDGVFDNISLHNAGAAEPSMQREHRRDATSGEAYSYNLRLGRNLLDYRRKKLQFQLDLSYFYSRSYSSNGRTRELQDDASAPAAAAGRNSALPSLMADGQWQVDLANSYHTGRMESRHSPGVNLKVQVSGLMLRALVNLDILRRSISDMRQFSPQYLRRRDASFSPMAEMTYVPWRLRFNYYYVTGQPEMLYLLEVRDVSDPLNVYLGNAALKDTRRHSFTLSHNTIVRKRQRNFSASLRGELIRNAVGNSRIYDPQTGVTTHRPRNINGNWWGEARADYGQALDRAGRLMLASKGSFRLTHSVDFASASQELLRSVVDNYRADGELTLNYRTTGGIHVGAKGNAAYTRQQSRSQLFRNNSSTDFSYGLTLTAPVTRHLGFDTDIMAYARRGYTDRSMNTTDWVWNAAFSYTLGRHKQWLLRAVGFDLLHQLSSVRRVVNEQGYTETRYNTMPSYATLHVIYRLNVKPKERATKQ